jgi:hypothetical protein
VNGKEIKMLENASNGELAFVFRLADDEVYAVSATREFQTTLGTDLRKNGPSVVGALRAVLSTVPKDQRQKAVDVGWKFMLQYDAYLESGKTIPGFDPNKDWAADFRKTTAAPRETVIPTSKPKRALIRRK